jgi:hypothetical protein
MNTFARRFLLVLIAAAAAAAVSSPQQTPKPLTNADVIRMVTAGVPDSSIIALIRTKPQRFDLTRGEQEVLLREKVSKEVLDAMIERSKQVTTLNPKLDAKLAAPESGPRVKNPRAIEAEATLIAELQRQMSAADIEASQMKFGIRPPSQAGMLGAKSQPSSTIGGSVGSVPTAAVSAPPAASSGNKSPSGNVVAKTTAPIRTTAAAAPSVGNAGPEQVSSAAGNNPSGTATLLPQVSSAGGSGGGIASTGGISASTAQLHYLDSTALTCAHDPTMRIFNVSGSGSPATFTPIAQYNFYTITGCSFGNIGSNAKAYIYKGATFREEFQIQEWNDNGIKLNLDPNIGGVTDQDGLTLVVQRADGQQASKSGFKFYAVRETVLLQYIPPAWRKLDYSVGSTWGKHPTTQDNSPVSGPNVPAQAAGTTIFVSRKLGEKFTPSSDSFEFSQLPPGWVVEGASWTSFPATCANVVTYKEDFGSWNLQWSSTGIQFSWADTSCSGFWPNPALGGIPTDVYQNHTESNYALMVWVRGPRGAESYLPHF